MVDYPELKNTEEKLIENERIKKEWLEKISLENSEKMVESIAREVLSKADDLEEGASLLLDMTVKRFLLPLYPEKVEFRSNMYGHTYLVCGVKLPEPYPKDGWGRELEEEWVKVKDYNYAFPSLEGYRKDAEEVLGRKVEFFFITQPVQEAVINELAKYVLLDGEDIKDTPELGCLSAIAAKTDAPLPEWNEKWGKIYREREEKRKRERKENLEKNIELIKNILEREIESRDELKAVVLRRGFRETKNLLGEKETHYDVVVDDWGYESTYSLLFLEDKKLKEEEIRELLEELKKIAEKNRQEVERVWKIKRGEIPVIRIIRNKEVVYSCTLPELIQGKEIPEEVAGLIIGRGGSNIKKLSLLAGRKIYVNRGKPLLPRVIDRMKAYYELNVPAFNGEKLKKILGVEGGKRKMKIRGMKRGL